MRYIVKSQETIPIEKPGLDIAVYDSEDPFASASMISVDGGHHRIKSTHSDRIYHVNAGSGWFEVEGVTTAVGTDDVIFLPRETGYSYGGKMKLFLVHAPGYLASGDQALPPLDTAGS